MPLLVIGEMTRRTWEFHRQQLRPLAPRFPIIQRWIRTAERALFPALGALEAAPELARSTEIGGHQDLWPSHVLWLRGGRDGGGGPARLGGIIDFAEAAASSPLVDLAHLVTHFGGWTADRAETAMGIYSEIRRLSPEERRLLPAVATLDVIAEAGWLLTIAFALPERAAQVASSQLTMGATALVESLEVVTPVLLRGDAPIKPFKRRWEPRRPMPRPDGLARRPNSRPRTPRRPENL
jgi:Ser/Thr protein kinase RdoA (MazF antagonist)